jgi:hypothetical protein
VPAGSSSTNAATRPHARQASFTRRARTLCRAASMDGRLRASQPGLMYTVYRADARRQGGCIGHPDDLPGREIRVRRQDQALLLEMRAAEEIMT